jgi:phage N-6-adenine-methyltransferase
MNTDVMFSSKTDEWATPQDLFDYLDSIFHFTLDVCADETNHKCNKYYTKKDDGLKQSWDGVFWMNPPYGKEIYSWVEKAYNEAYKYKPYRNDSKDTKSNLGVLLLPARTDTKWFHKFCSKGEVIFLKGRLKFGDSNNSAPFPSMIVIFDGKLPPEVRLPMFTIKDNFLDVKDTYKVWDSCKLYTMEKSNAKGND